MGNKPAKPGGPSPARPPMGGGQPIPSDGRAGAGAGAAAAAASTSASSTVAAAGGGSGAAAGASSASAAAAAPSASSASASGAAAAAAAAASAASGGSSPAAAAPPASRKACLDDFTLLQTVGRGSFGKVIMVRHKVDQRIYAMKSLKKEQVLKRKQYEHTVAERRILENLEHPFIVSLRFAFQTEHKLYMVFDFFNGGELYHYLSEGGKFTEDRARFYAAEIVMALGYLHDNGIVYRDLKPENLILDSAGHIRVTDFGLSKEGVEGDTITSVCGTPEYLAPEIIRRQAYGAAVDWWSLGTLLYEMIAGLPPFYDRNRPMMYRKILEAPLEFPPDMSPEACDLISRMLARDPHARLGYGGSSEIKAHAFFRAYDWEKLYRREMAPPWTPAVASETDTHNIASEFTNEPPGVTPSPVGSRLRDVMGGSEEPPAFAEFTYSHASVLDGQTWRVSLSEEEGDAALSRDGFPVRSEGGGAGARVNLSGSTASSARSGSEEAGSEGGGAAEDR